MVRLVFQLKLQSSHALKIIKSSKRRYFIHLAGDAVTVFVILSPESMFALGFLCYFTVLTSPIPVRILNFFALKLSSATPELQYEPGPGLIVDGSKNLLDSGIENFGTDD